MSPLATGEPVVDFVLYGVDGTRYDSATSRADSLLLLVFWKRTCGTCQYSIPFLQRLHETYAGPGFALWGIAQESALDAEEFATKYGTTFPQLVDEDLDVTERYRLGAVPAFYAVSESDGIVRAWDGFRSEELNEIAEVAAERTGKAFTPVVRAEDGAPAFRPG